MIACAFSLCGDETSFTRPRSCLDAGLARTFIRDAYADANWDVFSDLASNACLGGSIALDDKAFCFFFPHGENSTWKGICRFDQGRRVMCAASERTRLR
jgi:hypothetical protein